MATYCANCHTNGLLQSEGSWFCYNCCAIGLGQQPSDIKETPCSLCGTKTFHADGLCYLCWKKTQKLQKE